VGTFISFAVYISNFSHNLFTYSRLTNGQTGRRACRKFIPFLVAKISKLAVDNIKTVGRNSSVCTATCYGLDGPGIESRLGVRISTPFQTVRGAHPTSYTMSIGFFPGVKQRGRSVEHSPPTSAEFKERVELYLYSPYGPSWLVLY